jgi:hypothetical protein
MAVTWVAMVAYWWKNVCWETWQPCNDAFANDLGWYVFLGGVVGVVVSIGWLLILRRDHRRRATS